MFDSIVILNKEDKLDILGGARGPGFWGIEEWELRSIIIEWIGRERWSALKSRFLPRSSEGG